MKNMDSSTNQDSEKFDWAGPKGNSFGCDCWYNKPWKNAFSIDLSESEISNQHDHACKCRICWEKTFDFNSYVYVCPGCDAESKLH